jgi:hypothetical protein
MYCVVREVRVQAIPHPPKTSPITKTVFFPEDAIITEIRIEPHFYPLEKMDLFITIYDQNDIPYLNIYTFSSKDIFTERVLTARDLYVMIGRKDIPIRIKKIEFNARSSMQTTTGYFIIWIMYWTKEPQVFYQVI